jgi:hypothetical protein
MYIADQKHINGAVRSGPQCRHTILTRTRGEGNSDLDLLQSTDHSSQNIERVGTYRIRDREVAEQTHAVATTTLLDTSSRSTGAVTLRLVGGDRGVVEGVTAATVTTELDGEVLVRGVRSRGTGGRAEITAGLLGETGLTRECWTIQETLTSGISILDTSGVITAHRVDSSACQRVGGSTAGDWSRGGRNRSTGRNAGSADGHDCWNAGSANGHTGGADREACWQACVRILFALSAKLLNGSVHQCSVLKCSVLCKEKEKLCVSNAAG